jgi:hypothetical protein
MGGIFVCEACHEYPELLARCAVFDICRDTQVVTMPHMHTSLHSKRRKRPR